MEDTPQAQPLQEDPHLTRADVAHLLPIDERLITAHVHLASEVALDLYETLRRVTGPFKLPGEGWAIFVLYYAARVYGAFSGGIMLRSHGFDREAQFMERAMYEYFSKLLYHSTFKEEGDKALASFPKHYQRMVEKLRYDPARFMDEEQMALSEQAVEWTADVDFKDMRERMIKSPRFTKQAEKAQFKFYLKESRNRWNLRYVMPSQIVHGSLMDVLASSKLDDEGMSVTSELESEKLLPNTALIDSCQFAVHTARHVEDAFGLPESAKRVYLLNALLHRV